MKKIGFVGLGVMGLPMAKNLVAKSGCTIMGYDVVQKQMDALQEAGGVAVADVTEIYKTCDIIMQMLPTHAIIINSIEQAIQYGKPGNIIVDLDSTAPEILQELLRVDVDLWKQEVAGIKEFYAKFGDKLPDELTRQLSILENNLN